MIRQGDILLVPVSAERRKRLGLKATLPANPKRHPTHGLVVAEGNSTGHNHVVKSTDAKLVTVRVATGDVPGGSFNGTATRFLHVKKSDKPVKLTHEEHHPLTIPEGWFEVRRQREHVPASRVGGASRSATVYD